MLKVGSRFMIVSGKLAGEMATVVDVDMELYPEITCILDSDRKRSDVAYTYVAYRNIAEV